MDMAHRRSTGIRGRSVAVAHALALALSAAACDGPGEEGEATDQPIQVEVRGVTVTGASMTLENRDGVPFADRLVTSILVGDKTGQITHDRAVLRVTSSGTTALTLSGLTISGPFSLSPKPALPATIAPGSSLDLALVFAATGGGKVQSGSLSIASNVAGAGSVAVSLAGIRTKPEGGNEPSLVQVVQALGYGTVIVGAGQQLDRKGHVEAIGDETVSPFWKALDPTRAIAVRQLAAYHTRGGTGPIAWYDKGSTTTHTITTSDGKSAQTVLPTKKGSTTAPSAGTFTPGGVFGLKVAAEFSDPTRNNITKDMQNGCVAPCGHHVRFWQARNRVGDPIPGTFIIGMDSASVNYDYQDDVFLISNIAPQ
jgi:hypothetical protein